MSCIVVSVKEAIKTRIWLDINDTPFDLIYTRNSGLQKLTYFVKKIELNITIFVDPNIFYD
jgi:hypothetical protein